MRPAKTPAFHPIVAVLQETTFYSRKNLPLYLSRTRFKAGINMHFGFGVYRPVVLNTRFHFFIKEIGSVDILN